ncbi:MAG TPA: LON peptidase substrate-binding domain-containing protein [Chloroflexota bacterium]|jgi:Lon protease-like protein|nr:LON peptidase substrate-binding domain-containing protein [Chloroflexota bacterium]
MTEPPPPEDRGAGRRELPLFPLSTVLFPGAFLPLHIFELRYRTMIRRCLRASEPEFGVLLIKEGDEVLEDAEGQRRGRPPMPYPVGTVARIFDARSADDGRLRIACVGTERIRLRRLVQEEPYLVGEVEPLVDADESEGETGQTDLSDSVRRGIGGLLKAVREGTPERDVRQRLLIDAAERAVPTDAGELSFFVPRLLSVASPEERQRLLDAPSLRQRLYLEHRLLARERLHVLRLKRAGSRPRFDSSFGSPSLN